MDDESKYICEECGEDFDTENELLAHYDDEHSFPW